MSKVTKWIEWTLRPARFLRCFSICHLQPRQDNSLHFISRGIWLQHLVSVRLELLISGTLHFSTGLWQETLFHALDTMRHSLHTQRSHYQTQSHWVFVTNSIDRGEKIKWFNKSNSNLHKPLKPDTHTLTPLFLSFSTPAANVFH